MTFSLSIIGAGRLGGALAIALDRRGYEIKSLVSLNSKNAVQIASKLSSQPQLLSISEIDQLHFAPLILIATPDSQIELTAERLAALEIFRQNQSATFLHTSGALDSNVLNVLPKNKIGSLHPLISVSDAQTGAEKFKNAYFCLEGGPEAVTAAAQIVLDLEGISFSIPTEKKPLYHAAAVLSSGHLVALFDLAIAMLAKCGLSIDEAQKVLLPLVQSTIENLAAQTPAAALTGTFARADVETMNRHLAALSDFADALKVYCELGRRSLNLAARQGADPGKLREMDKILENAEEKVRNKKEF